MSIAYLVCVRICVSNGEEIGASLAPEVVRRSRSSAATKRHPFVLEKRFYFAGLSGLTKPVGETALRLERRTDSHCRSNAPLHEQSSALAILDSPAWNDRTI